jgi:hypothetical protein
MAVTPHYTGQQAVFTEAFAASGGTSTLPAPGAGLAWRIDSISFLTVTAFSVWSIDVQENAGTSCWKAGATTAAWPGVINGPIATKVNDAPKVVLATTGATASGLNITATLVGSG